MNTGTDYMRAYLKAQARVDELEKMLAEQIKHTSDAIRESDCLMAELAECLYVYEANHG